MMKWNSAKNYTEEDIIRMQKEAENRVRDFQARAKSAASFYDVPPSQMTELPDPVPEKPAQPLEEEPEVIEAQSRVIDPVQQTQSHPNDPIHGILDKLNIDNDTLLILGLMFLLYNEKADNVLLLALAYLLL